jgi:hypothetical protein
MIKNKGFNNNNNNKNKRRKASNRLFEVIELYESEPITFQSKKRNKRQTDSSNQDNNMDKKRKIMLVIPSK